MCLFGTQSVAHRKTFCCRNVSSSWTNFRNILDFRPFFFFYSLCLMITRVFGRGNNLLRGVVPLIRHGPQLFFLKIYDNPYYRPDAGGMKRPFGYWGYAARKQTSVPNLLFSLLASTWPALPTSLSTTIGSSGQLLVFRGRRFQYRLLSYPKSRPWCVLNRHTVGYD